MQELRDILSKEIEEVAADAVTYFQKAIEEKGLIFEDILRTEFQHFMSTNSTVIAAEIHFMGYGRYKDMKTLRWTDTPPPIEAMVNFVTKVGINKFAWIPGYEKSGKVPAETIAIKRLARTIQYSFVNTVTKKKYAGTWYASTKGRMLSVARRRIMDITAQYSSHYIVTQLEKPK